MPLITQAAPSQADNIVTGFKPQEGPQTAFFQSKADIVIYGGAAGGGKTYALLGEVLRWSLTTPGFTACIFRQEASAIETSGGLWDQSEKVYLPTGARPVRSPVHKWTWPSGAEVQFRHMNGKRSRAAITGSEICLIGFDELHLISESDFWFCLSRNRSVCGVRPYVRATCNPDPESFVAKLIEWWIEQDETSPNYGLPIPERAGVVRYFVRGDDGKLIWGGESDFDKMGLLYGYANLLSLTFIPATTKDNQKLMESNPEYLARLRNLPASERAALENGNWKILPIVDGFFKTSKIVVEKHRPDNFNRVIRTWDFACTEDGGDWTVGMLLGLQGARIWCLDIVRGQWDVGRRNQIICDTAVADNLEYGGVRQYGELQPGPAGKDMQHYLNTLLEQRTGAKMIWVPTKGKNKTLRAETMAEVINEERFYMLESPAAIGFIRRMGQFPSDKHPDDEIDTGSMGCVLLRDVNVFGPANWGKGRNRAAHTGRTTGSRKRCYQIAPGQMLHTHLR